MANDMVTNADARTWHERLLTPRTEGAPSALEMFALALLADRERLLGLLRESVDDQLGKDELPNGDKRLRCDMCGVVLTYWRAKGGGKHERAHNEGCLIPKWEALLKEAGREGN